MKDENLEQHRAAVLLAVQCGHRRAASIGDAAGFGTTYEDMRIVDRALQYWRKKGKLRFDSKDGWSAERTVK